MFQLCLTLLVSFLALAAISQADSIRAVEEQSYEEHGAHQHGVAHLRIALADKLVEITLDSPAANVYGFEHEASSEADKKVVAETSAKLAAGADLFALDAAAQCKFEKAELVGGQVENEKSTENTERDKHKHEHAANDEPTHRDVVVNWLFSCAQPTALKTITPQFFTTFSGFKKLEVEWVTGQNASAATLETNEPIKLIP